MTLVSEPEAAAASAEPTPQHLTYGAGVPLRGDRLPRYAPPFRASWYSRSCAGHVLLMKAITASMSSSDKTSPNPIMSVS